MNSKALDLVAKATVKTTKYGGQGVLVGGGFILTAAHCVEYDTAKGSGHTLGDYIIEGIETAAGETLQVTPWAIEPVSDVALLGPLDSQECPEEVEALENFCLNTKGVPLYLGKLSEEPLPVWIRTHKGGWIKGDAAQYGLCTHRVVIKAREQIEGGTSGGPIVTDDGKLVAIVSQSDLTGSECMGSMPRPNIALPVWAAKLIKSRRFDGFW